jgi:dinuclear metal center YbgI/SA1388 family protein
LKIKEIIQHLESHAPLSTQESYDNSGLICGDSNGVISGILLALDCTEAIVNEAIEKKCNMIIAHHPIVFKGLKSFTGKNYVERTVIKAIKNDIAIYAIHTNLDNYRFGVNYKIGTLLGLKNLRILEPKRDNQVKLVIFVPQAHAIAVREAMCEAGAGKIGNYDSCSFSTSGDGTFRALKGSNPFVGEADQLHTENETRLELICRNEQLSAVLSAMQTAHPYEEVACDIIPLKNQDPYQGAGMIGELEKPLPAYEFLSLLKETFRCSIIKHTELCKENIERVAFCGGSGSFLLNKAKASNADIFITGDYKYHDFFDAENRIIIADIGHYESEQFTTELIADLLKEKNITFAVRFAETNTNPVKYF